MIRYLSWVANAGLFVLCCFLLASNDATTFVLLAGGTGSSSFSIPGDPGLVGISFYNQYAEIRPTSATGIVFSNGGAGTVL